MAKNKTKREEPHSQETPEEDMPEEPDATEDDDILPPLPPLKGKFYPTYPNDRPAKLHTTYPY